MKMKMAANTLNMNLAEKINRIATRILNVVL